MITTVIFDMNGVITDDEELHELATKMVFDNVGLVITSEIYRQYCLGRTDAAAFVDLIKVFALEGQKATSLIADKSIMYQELVADNLKVYPGVIELIEKLDQKYTLALTTSSTFNEVQAVMTQLQLGNRFKIIVSAQDVKHGKPDPEPYLLTAKKLGVECKHCVVIEDSENGVRSAKAAGMKCVAIPNTEERGKLVLADYIIDDYSEITQDLIQHLG